MRLFFLACLSLSLAACAHEAENTGIENSSVITLSDVYAMEMTADSLQEPTDTVTAEGRISRPEPRMVVTGGPDVHSSPAAASFDEVMDRLEGLMADRINENNRRVAAHNKYLTDLGLPPSY